MEKMSAIIERGITSIPSLDEIIAIITVVL